MFLPNDKGLPIDQDQFRFGDVLRVFKDSAPVFLQHEPYLSFCGTDPRLQPEMDCWAKRN